MIHLELAMILVKATIALLLVVLIGADQDDLDQDDLDAELVDDQEASDDV